MKRQLLFLVLLSFLTLSFFISSNISNAEAQQTTTITPENIKKTYWCAEIQDIMLPEEPQQGQKFSVGVQVKFTKRTIISGAPNQKLCNCAFQGPPSAPVKFWLKTMSIRLIGIKYSEKETNLLEYYGPTPAFPPYSYGGFPVIGFVVTENDLKKGYIDLWGWASKEALICRDFDIHASFATYPDAGPYDQKNECHPHPDFKKSFKPKCLKVPEINEDMIKKEIP